MISKRPFLLVSIWFVFLLACQSLTPSATHNVSTPAQAILSQPTATVIPAEIQSEPTAFPITEMIDDFGVPMVLIPEGEFIMGSQDGELDEQPVHTVYLDAYYIDKYEVTHALYKDCLDAGICKYPDDSPGSTYSVHHYSGVDDHYPMFNIDWEMARIYCETWRGARLPTEAQWEKAARGTEGQVYPWGDVFDSTYANVGDPDLPETGKDTSLVGSYTNDKSPYGVYDMIGNVSEWVNDWYGEDYYQNSPSDNPEGQDSGTFKVVRGGAWSIYGGFRTARPAERIHQSPTRAYESIGFRCTKDANP